MKKITIITLLISCFLTPAFAETTPINQGRITITGEAEMYVPATKIILQIKVDVEGKTIQEVEKKGYAAGIKLKNVFKKFGINEKHIIRSNQKSHLFKQSPYKEDSIIVAGFKLEYTVIFNQFDLIDTLRKKSIAAGATYFQEVTLDNPEMPKYIKKLKKLTFQDAKYKAEAIIEGSGFKLGLPLELISQHFYEPHDTNNEGLGAVAVGIEETPLLRQKKILLQDSLKVTFSIEKII